jgi:hypothetical protein
MGSGKKEEKRKSKEIDFKNITGDQFHQLDYDDPSLYKQIGYNPLPDFDSIKTNDKYSLVKEEYTKRLILVEMLNRDLKNMINKLKELQHEKQDSDEDDEFLLKKSSKNSDVERSDDSDSDSKLKKKKQISSDEESDSETDKKEKKKKKKQISSDEESDESEKKNKKKKKQISSDEESDSDTKIKKKKKPSKKKELSDSEDSLDESEESEDESESEDEKPIKKRGK